MRQIVYIIILFLFPLSGLVAQTKVSGTVASTEGELLVGANVFLMGTYDGATTDTAGNFAFKTVEKGTFDLLVLYLGYDTLRQQVALNGVPVQLNLRLKAQKNELNEVVVTAGAFEATSDRRRASVLSALDVALTASASADIAGAMTMLPGTTRNGETGQILVRGGAAYETRTFMDGLLIQNPYSSTVGNLPARNRFSPFLFKGTLFSTGGYSAEYGQAMSSALILNTEDLAPKTTTGITLLSVGAGLARTKRWERTSLSVSGNYNNLRPYFALVPQKVEWLKVPQSGVGEVVFRQQTSENGGILKGYLNVNHSNMQMNYLLEPGVKSPLQLKADNVYGNFSYREMLDKNWLLFAGVAYTFNRDAVNSNFNNTKTHTSGQARFTLSRSLSDMVKLKVGGEFYKSHYDEKYRTAAVQLGTLLNENFSAAFAETDLFISKKIVGRVGGRMEYSHLLDQVNVAPRVSLAYLLGKKEQISLAFGQFYQTPEYDQMRAGVRDLTFENATHLMLNYQVIRNGYIFRVEGYQKWYDNLLKTDHLTDLPANTGAGYARGVDVFLRDNKSVRNGDYWVSYSYLDTQRDWKNFPVSATPDFAMKHSFSVAYKQFFPKLNTAFSASYAFNSGRPYYDPNLPQERFMTSRTPAYHDVSVAVSYLTNIAGHFTVVFLSVQNVPGFRQTFGYRYSEMPVNGVYEPVAITPPARRFGVLAIIMSIGEKYKKQEVTSDDY